MSEVQIVLDNINHDRRLAIDRAIRKSQNADSRQEIIQALLEVLNDDVLSREVVAAVETMKRYTREVNWRDCY